MLTPNEEKYLSKISDDLMVEVVPWNPRGLDIAQSVIDEIKSVLPQNEIVFIGSLPLKIAGQKDVDLSVLSPSQDFPICQPKLEETFGKPDKLGTTSIGWHFIRDGYEIGIYLTDPETSDVQNQIKVYNILKNNPDLLKEYEAIKLSAAKGTYKNYQIKKYDFYHKILGME